MKYQTQARNERKYFDQSYLSARRWSSYAIQIREAMLAKPKKILEIGPGNNIVTENLKKLGYEVKTLDIDLLSTSLENTCKAWFNGTPREI